MQKNLENNDDFLNNNDIVKLDDIINEEHMMYVPYLSSKILSDVPLRVTHAVDRFIKYHNIEKVEGTGLILSNTYYYLQQKINEFNLLILIFDYFINSMQNIKDGD